MSTTIEEKIAIMQAFANGKKIEIYNKRLKMGRYRRPKLGLDGF